MTFFSGPGKFSLIGEEARVYDCLFGATLELNGSKQIARGVSAFDVSVLGGRCSIDESWLGDVDITGTDGAVQNSYVEGTLTASGDRPRIVGNLMESNGDGAVVSGDDAIVQTNTFLLNGGIATDTYDSVRLTGNRALVMGNKFVPDVGDTRSAVNIAAGDCNRVVGNDLGDQADYATDAIIDAGTGTQLTYPNDPVYGDNFFECITSS